MWSDPQQATVQLWRVWSEPGPPLMPSHSPNWWEFRSCWAYVTAFQATASCRPLLDASCKSPVSDRWITCVEDWSCTYLSSCDLFANCVSFCSSWGSSSKCRYNFSFEFWAEGSLVSNPCVVGLVFLLILNLLTLYYIWPVLAIVSVSIWDPNCYICL